MTHQSKDLKDYKFTIQLFCTVYFLAFADLSSPQIKLKKREEEEKKEAMARNKNRVAPDAACPTFPNSATAPSATEVKILKFLHFIPTCIF